jgi:TDG/mug DNA glycosylase family protein
VTSSSSAAGPTRGPAGGLTGTNGPTEADRPTLSRRTAAARRTTDEPAATGRTTTGRSTATDRPAGRSTATDRDTASPGVRRPSADEVAAAADRTIPDVAGPGLLVLFSGINPSLYSAATGHHFARPGNRFWPALHGAGFTDRLLHPSEQHLLPALGLGITNVVSRATARADELSPEEFVEGGAQLAARVARLRPRYLAVLGVTAYRAAFKRPKARLGPQDETISDVPVWVLPNPSGLNAHFQLPALITEFAALRAVVLRTDAPTTTPPHDRPGTPTAAPHDRPATRTAPPHD